MVKVHYNKGAGSALMSYQRACEGSVAEVMMKVQEVLFCLVLGFLHYIK